MGGLTMGMMVYWHDQVLWSPGNLSGGLFLGEIRALERVLEQPSGVDTPVGDTMEIDAPAFAAFIRRALDVLEHSNNAPLFALTAGVIEVAIYLNAQITGSWPEVSDRLRPLVERARTVMHGHPPGPAPLPW